MKIFIAAIAALAFCACENSVKETATAKPEISEVTLTDIQQVAIDSAATASDQLFSPPEEQKNENEQEREGRFDRQEPAKQKQQTKPIPATDWDKKIVKTANVNVEVNSTDSFYNATRENLKRFGGYVAQEQQTEDEYKKQYSLTIKVPVANFDEAVHSLTEKVTKVNERSISSEDVTLQVVDTKSRLEAKKQVRQRYLELLKQAHKMDDILQVQSEINEIQEEIEAGAGRVNYLSQAATFSTIHLSFYQVINPAAANDKAPGFASRISYAFKTGGEWVLEIFIGLISIWPLLVIALLIFIAIKKRRIVSPKSV